MYARSETVIRGEKRRGRERIEPGDKRRQVASGGGGRCMRGEKGYKRREGTMRVIVPGDKRRQVASGVYARREDVIREDKGQ